MTNFADREQAARALAERLAPYRGAKDGVVLAIPRGGVVVGRAVADALALPLDVALSKKIGHPREPEYAIGVVDLDGAWVDPERVAQEGIPRRWLEREAARIREGLRERAERYRGGRPAAPLKGRTVIVADDGIATGETVSAVVRQARRAGAAKVVVAAPVCAPLTARRLRALADDVCCVLEPDEFFSIGQFYERFGQVGDDEAIRCLRGAPEPSPPRVPQPPR